MIANDLEMVRTSHERLRSWVTAVPPTDPTEPSRLDGWTVGHLLTHIARNADSFTRLLQAGADGVVGEQYGGSPTRRHDEIESGASRPWTELVDDVVSSSEHLDTALTETDDAVLATAVGNFSAGTFPLAEIPFRRTREVEVHRVDLGLGASIDDWPHAYVELEWRHVLGRLADRLPPEVSLDLRPTDAPEVEIGVGVPVVLVGSTRELLAWVCGRHLIPGAPPLSGNFI